MPYINTQFPGSISIKNLDGVNGFITTEDSIFAGGGDINADGIADMAFGTHVVFGKSGIGNSGSIDVANLNGSNGFVLTGFLSGSSSASIYSASDINADGIADLIIVISKFDYPGAAYVVFGASGIGSSGSFNVSTLTGSNGFFISGFPVASGVSAVAAGDINADNIADMFFGAPFYSDGGVGSYIEEDGICYVIFGQSGIGVSGSFDVSLLNGANGFVITGFRGRGGYSLSGTGDVNGDGIGDLLIGAPVAVLAPSYAGMCYVIFGKSGIASSGSLNVVSLNGLNGFAITGFLASGEGGYSVSGPGDVNDDGIADLLIGAPFAPNDDGVVYVIFGQSGIGSSGSFDVTALDGANGFSIGDFPAGGCGGWSVSGVGDFNGDGIADLLIAASQAFNSAGTNYLIFGQSNIAPSGSLSVLTLNGLNGFAITGFSASQFGGWHVVATGDINHDGLADIALGTYTGQNYIIFGEKPVSINIIENNLVINQGQTIVLTSQFLNVTNPSNPLKDSALRFYVNSKHGYFSNVTSTFSLSAFTQQQVRTGKIKFVHDGSRLAPSYNVSVGHDGLYTATPPLAASISFDAIPLIITNTLMVNQGQTVVISSSNLIVNDPYATSFTFLISSLQHGYFALISAPTTSITQFTQVQIQSGNIQFVHDGTSNPPSYSVTVTDGRLTSSTQAASISFDIPPTISINTLAINKGQTVVLSSSNLSASSPYSSSFTFTISNVQHGFFAYTSNPSAPITTFTQTQLFSGTVQFVHDGTSNPPSYLVTVSDGRMSASQAATISFDVPPVLVTNTLTINQGQTILLTTSNLSASDAYTTTFTFVISNLQHGYFSLTSAPATAITQFTQTQIQSGIVQFVHDGSANAPSYSVTASDGRMSSSTQPASISFDVPPTLLANTLTINQGQTVVLNLSNLNAADLYSSGFTFSITNLQHGYFALTSAPSTPITQFTLGQIQSGIVGFVHDGSSNPPGYSVSVSDGRLSSTAQAASVSFDAPPTINLNALTINQGQTVVLDAGNLSASSPYSSSSSFTFIITNIQHGYFALVSSPSTAITSFSQVQIQSGSVQFVQDGTSNPPSYAVTVSDGRLSSASQLVTVSFDAIPIIVTNMLVINQGQTVVLTTANLSAYDPYASAYTFIISDVQHGYFVQISNPNVPITSFNPTQIQSGDILFVHDGTTNPPSYDVMLSDGRLSSAIQAGVISFDAIPVIANNSLTINQGQTVILSTIDLDALNPYNVTASLGFSVSKIKHGYFSLTESSASLITSFTQVQLRSGIVQFTQDGTANPPSFEVAVGDGRLTSAAQSSVISFDIPPSLTTNTLVITQGVTVVLSENNLSASSPYASSFTFTVDLIQYGYFSLVTAPSVPITTFTQTQIQNGDVQFTQDGSVNAPTYRVTVSDSRMSSSPQSCSVTFSLNPPPILVHNSLSVQQGETIILNSSELSATDNDGDSFTFAVSDVQHGYFALITNPSAAITSFTQAQIQAGQVEFIADGGALAPSYNIQVSDGFSTTQPAAAVITFTPTAAQSTNSVVVRNSIIGGSVSGGIGLLFLALKLYVTKRTSKNLQKTLQGGESEIEKEQAAYKRDVVTPIATKVFDQIDTTGFMGYRNEKDAKAYILAVEKIISELDKVGVDINLKNMKIVQRAELINEIAKQTQKFVVHKPRCCSMEKLYSFFKPEATPQQIEEKAAAIALAVKQALKVPVTTDVELSDVKVHLSAEFSPEG